MGDFSIPFAGRSHDFTDEEVQLVVEIMRGTVPLTQGIYLQELEKKFHYPMEKTLGSEEKSLLQLQIMD